MCACVDKPIPSNGGSTGKGWQPGKSGNPKGRPPRAFAFGDLVAQVGAERTPDGTTRLLAVVRNLYSIAEGDGKDAVAAAREILGRVYGAIPQRMQVSDDRPINLTWPQVGDDAFVASGADDRP